MRRTCNQAERHGQPDQPKTGSNNQEDKISGYQWRKLDKMQDKTG
jgi:hypothetical protein